MNVLNVLVSAITEETADALQIGTETCAHPSSEMTSGPTTSPITEYEMEDTPADRILTLLDASGGRMYQQDVVVETGYSPAMVSRLLSELEEDDQIARLRKGRKKIVVDPELLPPILTE